MVDLPHAHVGSFVGQRVHDVVNGVHADGGVVLLVHRHGNSASSSSSGHKWLRGNIVVLQEEHIICSENVLLRRVLLNVYNNTFYRQPDHVKHFIPRVYTERIS